MTLQATEHCITSLSAADEVIIRRAAVSDAAVIALLARVTFSETFSALFSDQQDLLDYFDHSFSVEKIRSSIEKENNIYVLAFYKDLPVGYAKFKKYSPSPFINAAAIAQLQKIYVLKDFLFKGIGQQLLHSLFDKMEALEKEWLWLSVFVDNIKAIRFYERNGFIAAGEHTYSIGKETFDFIVMKKKLAKAKS